MRILGLPINYVKFSIRSKRSRLLAVAAVSAMAILLVFSFFIAKRSSAHGVATAKKKQQGCCSDQPAVPRRMIGTYYTTEDGFQSTLILNNKGPNQILVTPILHHRNGQTYTASPVAVSGQSSSEVDLNLLASIAGPQFRSGSFEFTYEGRLLEMGGGLRIVNAEKSLIFDEQMLEPGMKFPSSRLEAVYAVPFEDSQVSVIVTNTTAQPIIVTGDAIFAGANDHHPIQSQLGAYKTQVINLPHGLVKKASAGAVSLNHNGTKGALLAMIYLQDADRGYSQAVNFTNPGGKSMERHGAGLRLGSVDNDPLKAVIAVRNIGENSTTVTATVPYSKQNGDSGTIALPQISLAPGEIKLLNTSNPQLRRNDFATAGLEIRYTDAPGSVIATASSVSQSGNHVFTLPMKDPQGGLSSTGGYPWFIKDTASTVVFIKNVTDQPQDFILSVVHSEGVWRMKPRLLDPRQTIAIDVKKIRDSQERGMDDDLMPPDAASGHISWGARGTSNKKLIGRAQMVDFENGMASTYECQCQCPPSWGFGARMVPWEPGGLDSLFVGDSANVELQSYYYDCFGNNPQWFTVYPPGLQHSFSNPSVAIFGNYQIIAVGAGNAIVDVGWGEKTYTPGLCESGGCEPCGESDWTAWASESITVQARVGKIQYQSGSNYVDVSGTLYVLRGTTVTFQAVPDPATASWPAGSPVWGGTSGASGNGSTKSVTFNTASQSTGDFKTVTAQSGNTVTVNVVVYELNIVSTPRDNFPGRSGSDYGVGEEVDLSFTTSPSSITASQAGGLDWSIDSGGGTIVNGTDGTGVYTAPDNSSSPVTFLMLKVRTGPSKDQSRIAGRNILQPVLAHLVQQPGTNIRHTQGTCSVGFKAEVYINGNVSWKYIEEREGTATGTGTGFYIAINGLPHPVGDWFTVGNCQGGIIGCRANTIDTVSTTDDPPPFSTGTFHWPVPLEYKVGNGTPRQFYIQNHHTTATSLGRATIEKAGAGPFSKNANDPTSFY